MKILVVDDNLTYLSAAREQLSEHEVMAVGSYDEGLELIRGKLNKKVWRYEGAERYDAVLVDLLMPASACGVGQTVEGEELEGTEMPVGIFLALLAAKNGAKYVAVHTDSNHHEHPASACFDAFNNDFEGRPDAFTVGSAKMILSNNRSWFSEYLFDDLSSALSYEEYEAAKKAGKRIVRAKNWKVLLEYLTRT